MTDSIIHNVSTLHRDEALDQVAAVLAYADASEESGSELGAALAGVHATLYVGDQLARIAEQLERRLEPLVTLEEAGRAIVNGRKMAADLEAYRLAGGQACHR